MATSQHLERPRRRDEPVYYTVEMLDALNHGKDGDGTKYEAVYGELLVTPPPRPWHEVIVDRLFLALHRYADGEPAAGYVSRGLPKFTFGRRDVYTMPDVWAVSLDEMRTLDWLKITVPLLCAEVLSKGTRRADRFTKRTLYLERGVPLYWVIDGDRHTVDVWRPGDTEPHLERERLTWQPAGARSAFTYALAELFAPL